MESKKKKVKFGFDCFRDSNYEKLKEYIKVKYNYITEMGKLENLGDRESYEIDIQWRMICDITEFIDQIDVNNHKISKYGQIDD
tara:strand:- start:140 stop:391 length:252 start_codon:yes stop_codon:yes gene_type:complete